MLSSVSVQEQKQMLGERLFPLIQAMHRDLAGKITGMLLEIDNSELIHMLESGESLRAKVGGLQVQIYFTLVGTMVLDFQLTPTGVDNFWPV